MKKTLLYSFLLLTSLVYSQVQDVSYTFNPNAFNEDESVTITIAGSSLNEALWGVTDNSIYLWSWLLDENDSFLSNSPNNGTWTSSNEASKFTYNNTSDTYSITFVPKDYFGATGLLKMGFLFKAKNGDGDKKTPDYTKTIGRFNLTVTAPTTQVVFVSNGSSYTVRASTGGGGILGDWTLKQNGTTIHQIEGNKSYSHQLTNITTDDTYELSVINTEDTNVVQSYTFQILITPTPVVEAIPSGIKRGINYHENDNTKVTLAFYAPGITYIHVAGSFNDYVYDNAYVMKKDSTNPDLYWIEITGLTPGQDYSYQYWITNNGSYNVKVADPYSTLVLDPSNDQYIDNTTFPNMPAYPTGKTTHAVTHFKTGQTPYAWQNTSFQKPAKEDLVIYELLLRDFDALHSFDAVKARLDYLVTLGINAIELMPVSEFDGNLSWGYNPSFHMALDKYYGSAEAFKQFIDECHNRGIAVILDVVYNHATGQNPYYRMWNSENGNYGGQALVANPFFNQTATHAYSVYNDFDHSYQGTKDYVKRTTQYWIEEFKIDGFRWDLTKGFTQNCNASDEGCTGSLQADRVAVLKEYADYQWEIDPNFYVIFEHLGGSTEELQWVNYRLNEGKGILMWGNNNGPYGEAAMGYHENGKSNFADVSYKNKGWSTPGMINYMESHDEERMTYRTSNFGNSSGAYDITNLTTALQRSELAAAFFFTVPGPKMIWQFGELGYDYSINYCISNGTINDACRTDNKPIRWNYFDLADRKQVYNTMASLIQLKKNYSIFKTTNFTLDVANELKRIHLTDDQSGSSLQQVTIIGNFGTTAQNITPSFQQTGTWYDLLNNNATINVTDVNAPISLQPGEFKIYGTNATSLSTEDALASAFSIYPNPIKNYVSITKRTSAVTLYNVLGKKVAAFKGNFPENYQFDTESLAKGEYILRAITETGVVTRKVIKN